MQSRTVGRGAQHRDERQTPVRRWRLPAVVLVMALLGGCARTSATCVGRTWDLRTPPSRAALGMPPGKVWFAFRCDQPREMTFELPGDVVLKLPSTLVTFDAYGAADPVTGDPATADVHTGPLSVDAAAKTATEILTTLGADTSEIAQWQRQAQAAAGTDLIKSPFIRGRVGYLGVEVQTVFDPHAKNAYVHVIFLLRD